MCFEKYLFVKGESNLRTSFSSVDTGDYNCKNDALHKLRINKNKLSELQNIFFANKTYGLLIILQGLDASGKDSLIKHVMTGVNPQGLKIRSFSTPTSEEFAHDYMWRCVKALPERGYIGIFNRSYYEEVLIQRVHPEFLIKQNLPDPPQSEEDFSKLWQMRFKDINNFERYLVNNGFPVIKIFLNISREEQKRRFLRRINRKDKNWKFRNDDLSERGNWEHYIDYYHDMMNNTSTDCASWFVIPADHKWFSRLEVSNIIIHTLEKLDLKYPEKTYGQKRAIVEAKNNLLNEDKVPLLTDNPMLRLTNH